MSDGEDLQAMARKLIDTALEQGSRDNVTALLILCSAPRGAMDETAIIPKPVQDN